MDDQERYRQRSLWLDGALAQFTPRPPLDGDRDVDVAIVGAGFTGLWTAYALTQRDPTLRIAIVEAETAGLRRLGPQRRLRLGRHRRRGPRLRPPRRAWTGSSARSGR